MRVSDHGAGLSPRCLAAADGGRLFLIRPSRRLLTWAAMMTCANLLLALWAATWRSGPAALFWGPWAGCIAVSFAIFMRSRHTVALALDMAGAGWLRRGANGALTGVTLARLTRLGAQWLVLELRRADGRRLWLPVGADSLPPDRYRALCVNASAAMRRR